MRSGNFLSALMCILSVAAIAGGCAQNESDQKAQTVASGEKSGDNAGSAEAGKPLPVWAPEAAQLKTLTVAVEPSGAQPKFQAKVPSDWQSNQHFGKGGQVFMWRGKARADDTCSVFMISTATQTPYQKQPLSAEEGMKVLLDSIRFGRQAGWSQTPVEKGSVEGRPFLRAYWSGVEPNKKKMMHGFCYTTVEGKDLVMISGQDYEPFCKETVAQSEAAALTYRIVPRG